MDRAYEDDATGQLATGHSPPPWFRPKATGVNLGNMTKNFTSDATRSKGCFAELNASAGYSQHTKISIQI